MFDQTLLKIIASLVFSIACAESLNAQDATSNESDSKQQWIQLFNGKDLSGWIPKIRYQKAGNNHANTFRVEDGVLKVSYDGYDNKFQEAFGHLFYKDKFSHYRLRVEYRFVGDQIADGPGWAFRNSGLMLHCQDPLTMTEDQDFPVSIEVQLLGGNGNDKRTTANLCTPGTNVVMDGKLFLPHCTSSSSDTFHGDQWVTAEVEVLGDGKVTHFVNGVEVLHYTQSQLDPRSEYGKTLIQDGQLLLSEGYISLQSESHPVEFRKVELLPLTAP